MEVATTIGDVCNKIAMGSDGVPSVVDKDDKIPASFVEDEAILGFNDDDTLELTNSEQYGMADELQKDPFSIVGGADDSGLPDVSEDVTYGTPVSEETSSAKADAAVNAEAPMISEAPLMVDTPLMSEAPAEEPHTPEAPAEEPHMSEAPAEEPHMPEAAAEEPLMSEAPAEEPHMPETSTEELLMPEAGADAMSPAATAAPSAENAASPTTVDQSAITPVAVFVPEETVLTDSDIAMTVTYPHMVGYSAAPAAATPTSAGPVPRSLNETSAEPKSNYNSTKSFNETGYDDEDNEESDSGYKPKRNKTKGGFSIDGHYSNYTGNLTSVYGNMTGNYSGNGTFPVFEGSGMSSYAAVNIAATVVVGLVTFAGLALL
ncbi:uncharacterized protein V2V93DRAFT_367523 [Kockiozyma suomiensis]|uniref:uncharacterized protein n=1 Tax=Kockiozyma suomiensis TaxID=1337062 RepID=UPI0033436325